MKLTKDEAQKIIDAGKAQGLNGRDIYNEMLSRGYQIEGVNQQSEPINAVKETAQDFWNIGKDIAESSQRRAENIQESSQARQAGEQSRLRTGLQQIGQLAGAGADAITAVGKGVFNTVLSDASEKQVTNLIQNFGEKVIENPQVKSTIEWYNSLPEKQQRDIDAFGGIVDLVSNFVGGGAVARGSNVLVDTATTAGKAVREGAEIVAENIDNTARQIVKPAQTATTNGVRNLDTFKTAVDRGFSPVDAKVFSELSTVDKSIARQMLDISENIAEGKVAITKSIRPVDLLGKNASDDIAQLIKIQKIAGKNVDNVANQLKGQAINTKEFNPIINQTLADYGITVKGNKISFKNSPFALADSVKKDITKAIKYITSPKKDALDIHRIKKTLDGLIKPIKVGEGLQGDAKRLVQDLRRVADDFLDNRFEQYKIANDDFRNVTQIIEEGRNALGKDFLDTNATQKIRSIFSNAGSRGNVRDFFAKLDKARQKYNLPDRGSLANQLYVAERLEDIYGTQALTGLRGQVEAGIKGTRAVVEGLRDPIKGIGSVAGEVVETIAKQRPKDRANFLKELLTPNK